MFSNKIKAKGRIEKAPKIDNKKVYLTLHTHINNLNKSESILYVEVTMTQWNKIKDKYNQFDVSITGQVQAKKTKSGIPLIFVKCTDIITIKPNTTVKSKSKKYTPQYPPKPPWYHNFDESFFVQIDINQIDLIESKHLTGLIPYNLIDGFKKPIAVKALENGRYALVAGVKTYFSAKLMNRPVKAYLTDLTHDEFIEKYCYE